MKSRSWGVGWFPGRCRREEDFLDILVAPSPKITLQNEGNAGRGVVQGGERQTKL